MGDFSRVVVKIGSNVLTNADKTLDTHRMSALVTQVASLRSAGIDVIMVSSGAVAAGRSELIEIAKTKHLDSISARQLFSAVGQAKLMNIYYELFREHGIACGQVLTTKEDFSTRRHYLTQKHCMSVMLENGVVPIVNENDTISVSELMFTDNDELSGMIASMVGAESLIILSNVDGVYDGNPADPASKVIMNIDTENNRINSSDVVQSSKSSSGRGGMGTKFRISQKLANEGVSVVIANGKRDNILSDIISGERERVPYTLFTPTDRGVSTIKRWIAHSDSFAKGSLTVNQGAYIALTSNRATSLLPIGVTAVSGDFDKDDIVNILSPDGEQFAVGKVSYSATEATQLIGTQGAKPIIHYDYMYILLS